MKTLLRLILEGDYKTVWMAADTLRDSSYGFESYPFWPQPTEETLHNTVCGADQRQRLEEELKHMSERQKMQEFEIDSAKLMADTTDIIACGGPTSPTHHCRGCRH